MVNFLNWLNGYQFCFYIQHNIVDTLFRIKYYVQCRTYKFKNNVKKEELRESFEGKRKKNG